MRVEHLVPRRCHSAQFQLEGEHERVVCLRQVRRVLAHHQHAVPLGVLVHCLRGKQVCDSLPTVEVWVAVAVELIHDAQVGLLGTQALELLLQGLQEGVNREDVADSRILASHLDARCASK